jgi:hypothetical protein
MALSSSALRTLSSSSIPAGIGTGMLASTGASISVDWAIGVDMGALSSSAESAATRSRS